MQKKEEIEETEKTIIFEIMTAISLSKNKEVNDE